MYIYLIGEFLRAQYRLIFENPKDRLGSLKSGPVSITTKWYLMFVIFSFFYRHDRPNLLGDKLDQFKHILRKGDRTKEL